VWRGAVKQGLLAETFRAEAQRLSEIYECTYSAQDEPGGHYQELAPAGVSGLVLGLRTSGSAGDLFLTTTACPVGGLEVDESDAKELVSLMRATAAGYASTRDVAVLGRTMALDIRFDGTTWAFPSPFLVRLFRLPRSHHYAPWPRRADARFTRGAVQRLTRHELEELDRLWTELARLFPGAGPPMTHDQMIEASVDALLAGVLSSAGRISPQGLAEFEAALSMEARSPALQSILDRIKAVLELGGDS
jgi:hypothetical protein